MSLLKILIKTEMQRCIPNIGEPCGEQAGIHSKNTVLLGGELSYFRSFLANT